MLATDFDCLSRKKDFQIFPPLKEVPLLRALIASDFLLQKDEKESLILVFSCLRAFEVQGGGACRLDDFPFQDFLEAFGGARKHLEHFSRLLESGRITAYVSDELSGNLTPFLFLDGCLYSRRQYLLLRETLEYLARRLSENFPEIRWKVSAFKGLSPQQKEAVEISCRQALTFISGGPGTGKTFLIDVLVEVFLNAGFPAEKIAVCAPTGKAVDRINSFFRAKPGKERPCAQTLHRLLVLGSQRKGSEGSLFEDCVIVDEASMLSLSLFHLLLKKMEGKGRLILVGDPEQLPPVNSFGLFRELIKGENSKLEAHRIFLKNNFRVFSESSCLEELPQQLFQGKLRLPAFKGASDLEFQGVESLEKKETSKFLKVWYARLYENEDLDFRESYDLDNPEHLQSLKKIQEHFDNHRILCFENASATGVQAFNSFLCHFHRQQRPAGKFSRGIGRREMFLPLCPVMMQVNDSEKRLFNGQSGLLIQEHRKEELSLVFFEEETLRHYPLSLLREKLQVLYALTVHKSQGSEYDHVVFAIPEKGKPGLRADLFYTALTRSRKSLLLLASEREFEIPPTEAMEGFSKMIFNMFRSEDKDGNEQSDL
jgi:exodeoxyribonuclease V alpha subunit